MAPIISTFGSGSARGFGRGKIPFKAISGEVVFITPGTHTFTVPDGVRSVSIVAVGGGGSGAHNDNYGGGNGGDLFWVNDLSVNTGETFSITVPDGTPSADGNVIEGTPAKFSGNGVSIGASSGRSYGNNPSNNYADANTAFLQDFGSRGFSNSNYQSGGRSGGSAGGGSISVGGAGAAGYSGNGGNSGGNNGDEQNPTAGSGGGGGGGGGNADGTMEGAGGGGVGLFGQGSSGAAGSNSNPTIAGGGGSSGQNGQDGQNSDAGLGGNFGGGGGSQRSSSSSIITGSQGALRIVFGKKGVDRLFPSTNVDQASSEGNVTTV